MTVEVHPRAALAPPWVIAGRGVRAGEPVAETAASKAWIVTNRDERTSVPDPSADVPAVRAFRWFTSHPAVAEISRPPGSGGHPVRNRHYLTDPLRTAVGEVDEPLGIGEPSRQDDLGQDLPYRPDACAAARA